VELFDLEASTFTRTHELEKRFAAEGRVWHVVGGDLLQGGREGKSPIQAMWWHGAELWENSRFAVMQREDYPLDPADLPPHHKLFEGYIGSSSAIRDKVFRHESIHGLVTPEVERYIERHCLYRGGRAARSTRFRLKEERLLVFADSFNPEAVSIAEGLGPSDEHNPSIIVVVGGDGTMLRAIRQHWRRRVPFYGLNTGHMGFLLNNSPPRRLLGHEFTLHQLPLLWVEAATPEGERKTALAFNDAWVERATGQTAWIQVKVNGAVRLQRLIADGALVASPAGSTSYARAMGAPPLPVNTPALVLAGSNVLKPEFWKPVVLPLDSEVELTTLDPKKRPIRGFIDGVPQGELLSMHARVSNIAAVELAFDPDHEPAEKLARIQFPPPEA
jgi:NAD kinase